MPFPPTFTNVWDTTFPPDTQLANLLGQDLRNLRVDVMQRLSLLSGTLANRPTPETVNATWGGAGFGLLYFSTDTSQIFQWGGAAWVDITANFVFTSVVASANLTAQVAAIGTTILYAVPVGKAGLYRFSYDIIITTVGTGGNINAVLQWNNGVATNSWQPAGVPVTVLGTEPLVLSTQTSGIIYSAASQNITFSTLFNSITGAVQYTFRGRLEYLG